MAVTAYIGNPGAGKSYCVVEKCREWIGKEKRLVVSNIPLTDFGRSEFGDLYVEYPKDKPPVCGWANLWATYPGAILIIDEPWRYWPVGLKANDMPEGERSLFAEHRHYTRNGVSSDIVLVTQSLSDIASFPRGKVETTFAISALTQIGQPNRYRIDIYSGVFTGKEGGGCLKVRELYGNHNSSVWRLYVSNTNSTESGQVQLTDRRASILNSLVVWLGIPLGLVAFVSFAVYFIHRHINLGDYYNAKTPSATEKAPSPSSVVVGSGASNASSSLSVVGVIGPYVVLSDGRVISSVHAGCLPLLGAIPTALPVCSRLPPSLPSALPRTSVTSNEENKFLPQYQ